ncbi:MAG TPA: PHP-associated domain-containing protein [Acidobacteriota bacterium]|nr:PHP-associated domain-containing protein [Acidobacteriota bacterium]
MQVVFERPDISALSADYMLVDMHFHSAHSHDCSTPVREIVERAEELDVHLVITDHNAISGVLEAERLAPGRVFPGLEVTTWEGKDILLYFNDCDALEDFFSRQVAPFIRRNRSSLASCRTRLTAERLFENLGDLDVLVSLPHPFVPGPRRSYPFFCKNPQLVEVADCIEVINQVLPHKSNLMAVGWAVQNAKPVTGGSDGHYLSMMGTAFTACKASNWREFRREVKGGRAVIVGEERNLRHQLTHVTRMLGEKAKVFQNRPARDRQPDSVGSLDT